MGLTSIPTPHPTPLDDDPVDCLRLIRSRRVGPVTWHRLMAEHGSAAVALSVLPEVARAAGVENYAICPVEVARHELAQGRVARARLIVWGSAEYPVALMDLPDAPPILWVKGDAALMQRPMIAMVGARNASSLGLRMARRLAEGVGQAGLVTVSGLARGIDAVVHEATLATGTVAVQAGGVDVLYPEENAHLMAQIAEQGCLVSEQPMGLQPQARHFPLRNRIVSGLSRAVVVVEAAARSGSLITARTALDQGRDVLAVPGHPFDARASGCNMLLRDGATLVRGPADVLEAIGADVVAFPTSTADAVPEDMPLPGPVPARRPLADIAAVHSQILARLGPSPLAEDQLIRDLSLPPATVAQHLLTLELDGRVHRAPGGLLSRTD
ncbi:MAG: DNA-processing protein DprA [Paracoccaceae bacterium]